MRTWFARQASQWKTRRPLAAALALALALSVGSYEFLKPAAANAAAVAPAPAAPALDENSVSALTADPDAWESH